LNRCLLIIFFFSSESNGENIQEFVKEMTQEIASEIKSEIQEVISQVDDILEISDSIDVCNANLSSISSILRYLPNSILIVKILTTPRVSVPRNADRIPFQQNM
jgi:hypothetical protein